MRLYKSHKVVAAAVIVSVIADEECKKMPQYVLDDGDTVAHPQGTNYVPKVGDYYVVYEDSYASLSPKAAFENGYVKYDPTRDEAEVAALDATRQALEALVCGSADALRVHMGCGAFTLPMDDGEVTFRAAEPKPDNEPELPLYAKDRECEGKCGGCDCAAESLRP